MSDEQIGFFDIVEDSVEDVAADVAANVLVACFMCGRQSWMYVQGENFKGNVCSDDCIAAAKRKYQ